VDRTNAGMSRAGQTFAGKAAPAYRLAKIIIKLVNNLARTIDADAEVRGRLKVVFLPEYNVSLAERSSARNRAQISGPDMPGSIHSTMTRSGGASASLCTASSPRSTFSTT
jgi:starch phosphorylase